MIFVMQIPMNFGDLLRVIALAPILALAGGSLGVFFIGFVQDPKVAGDRRRAPRVPADVPGRRADPGRELDRPPGHPRQAHADDLQHRPRTEHLLRRQARGRAFTVLNSPIWLDLAVTSAFFLVFTVVGTYLFVRADRNR